MSLEIFSKGIWNPSKRPPEGKSYRWLPDEPLRMEEITPFINYKGLTTAQYLGLISGIEKYLTSTQEHVIPIPQTNGKHLSDVWEPGKCNSVVFSAPLLKEAFDGQFNVDVYDSPRSTGFDHRWLELQIDGGSPVVVDTAGLVPTQAVLEEGRAITRRNEARGPGAKSPAEYMAHRIMPYVGRKNEVPYEIHHIAYAQGSSMNPEQVETAKTRIFSLEQQKARRAAASFGHY